MVFIRSVLIWISGIFILSTLSLLSFLVGLFDRSGDSSHRVARWWGRAIVWVSGIHVHVQGLDKINPSSTYIFAANHQSIYDIFILSAFLPVQFRYIVKKVLFKVPFLGMAMRAAGYISIDREDPFNAMKSIRDAVEKTKQGKSIVIFPEGTRSLDGKVGEFKRGSLLLASKAKLPIVPISLRGTFDIVPKGKFFVNRTEVYLTFHTPIEIEHLGRKEIDSLRERVRDIIASEVDKYSITTKTFAK